MGEKKVGFRVVNATELDMRYAGIWHERTQQTYLGSFGEEGSASSCICSGLTTVVSSSSSSL